LNAGTSPHFEYKVSNPSRDFFQAWVGVVIFSVAFASVENAVVIFLSRLYFDGLFEFPTAPQ